MSISNPIEIIYLNSSISLTVLNLNAMDKNAELYNSYLLIPVQLRMSTNQQ